MAMHARFREHASLQCWIVGRPFKTVVFASNPFRVRQQRPIFAKATVVVVVVVGVVVVVIVVVCVVAVALVVVVISAHWPETAAASKLAALPTLLVFK